MEKNGYDLGTLISVIKNDIEELITTKVEYYKLEVFEKTSGLSSFLIFGLIITNLVFFAFLFAFLALGFLFSNWIGSFAGGFGIVTLIYLLILLVIFLCRKSILSWLQSLFLIQMDPDLQDESLYEEKQADNKKRNTVGETVHKD